MEKEHYLNVLSGITTLIFDVDGIMTDGSILLTPEGEALRAINTKDGHAMARAVDAGYKLIAITRGSSKTITAGLMRLGFTDVALEVRDKVAKYEEFKAKYGFTDDQAAYMGDDLPDIDVLLKASLAACPADAVHEVREVCNYISPFNGGRGCVRDVIEKVMRSRDQWYKAPTHHHIP